MTNAELIDYDVATSTSTTYTLDFGSVQVGYKINTESNPNANGGEIVEVQNQTFQNPTYSLQGFLLTERTGTLTFDKLRELSLRKYNPAEKYLLLKIDYADTGSSILPDSKGNTSGIRVVIAGFSPVIGTSVYRESDRNVGVGSISFVETL